NNMFIADMIVFLYVWIQRFPSRRTCASPGHVGQPSDIALISVILGSNGVKFADARKEIQMNSSSNVFVLGVTGQVGKLVAKNLKRSEANFSVGTRRKGRLEELTDR